MRKGKSRALRWASPGKNERGEVATGNGEMLERPASKVLEPFSFTRSQFPSPQNSKTIIANCFGHRLGGASSQMDQN
jgi:hypothetical protein